MITVLLAVRDLGGDMARLWTYVTLAATGIIAEEATPVVAGFAAHQGHFGAVEAALAISAGTWAADLGLYGIGRWQARRVVARWPALRRAIRRLLSAVRRRPWRSSLAVRFAYGARLLLPLTCGAARLPFWLYVAGSAISALAWGFLFTALGWGFGDAAVLLLGRIKRHEKRIALLLGITILLIVMVLHVRNRNRVPGELGGDAPALPDDPPGAPIDP